MKTIWIGCNGGSQWKEETNLAIQVVFLDFRVVLKNHIEED